MERVSRRNSRPLLKEGDPREIMQRLMDERYPVYAGADITIESRNVPHDIIVEEIVECDRRHAVPEGDDQAEGAPPR